MEKLEIESSVVPVSRLRRVLLRHVLLLPGVGGDGDGRILVGEDGLLSLGDDLIKNEESQYSRLREEEKKRGDGD